MILDKLVLHNFCLYRGRQEFDLSPVSRDKPVVLVGGLNGGGKTTILDAVQLALYGSRAFTSKRDGTGYENYLRGCINRGVAPKDGASVAVHFRYVSEGEQHSYEVRRLWSEKQKHVRETVSVLKDGEQQEHLSKHWSDVVEELIPIGISRLFFFDAEQVRFLADDESSNQALGTAVKSLLGLDVAEKLIADASVLEGRLSEQIAAVGEDPELKKLLKELTAKEQEVRDKKQQHAALENERLRAEKARIKAESDFEAVGGPHWLEREARRKELEAVKSSEKHFKTDLVKLAASELPFALVPELVSKIGEQDTLEKRSRESAIVESVLSERDKEIVQSLRKEGVDAKTLKVIQKIQESDRTARKKYASSTLRHGLSESARATVQHLQNGSLTSRLSNAGELLDRFENARKQREQLERSLKMTPDDASVADIFDTLKSAIESESVLNSRSKRLGEELHSLKFQRDELSRKLSTGRRKRVDSDIDSEQAARMVKLAIRTQETMQAFLKKSTARKIGRLSQLVTESFQFLLRKQALVERVEIDPETFRISLFDTDGAPLSKERLSEGEKQIFAISVLWGLAKASPRPLPAIIDTPMARLDSEHRSHLVERYFPHASHQVIVLSTDAEVDQKYYPTLQPFVSHEYHLNYCEKDKLTNAEDGYFPAFRKERAKKKS